jgi:tRNA dimethylallyltransferase
VNRKTVILITGPTASGKTALAIQTAQRYNTEIISADSRQCFIEMNIGVAKPTRAELSAVPHHFINSHSIHDDVNAATFATYAEDVANKIFAMHDVLVLAGGTGLYIKAFLEGLDEIPAIDPAIRKEIIGHYSLHGIEWLKEQLRIKDPTFYAEGEILNPQRMMRALEVKTATGKSIKDFHKKSGNTAKDYDVKKYAIDLPREQLYDNINKRVDKMMGDGLLEEVRSLQPYRHLNALQTVGYTELFDHLDGKTTLEEAVEKIKQNTRNYAKRQLTWLRKEQDLQWIANTANI